MNRLSTIFVYACLGVLASGCGGDDEGDDEGGGGPNFYCRVDDDMGAIIGCNEHEIPGAARDDAEEACTTSGGTVVDACPSAGRIGSCSLSNGALVMNYYEAIGDAETAEEVCTGSGGDWSPS